MLTGIFQGIGQRLFTGIVDGLETVVSKMAGAVVASSNLNESVNKTGVVFGSAAEDIIKWSETSDRALGLSQQKALEAAGSFGALFRQMGQGPQASADLSKGLVQIASDLGSIYNQDPGAVLEKLQSGLTGASRPLREVNIFLSETAVNAKAVQLGLAASTDSVSEQAKVMARYALIVDQAKIAQGDFARTSGELANGQRILAAEVENGSARLGNSFRPAVAAIQNLLIGLAPQMFAYGQNITDQLANGLAAGIEAILPVIQTVRELFTYWFAPGSPPRVLPDIDKWGAAAMKQFLGGFSSVDVKGAFDTIGSAVETVLRSSVSAGKSSETGLVSAIFGTRESIINAVAEFARAGSVSESTINAITRSAGAAGPGIGNLVKAYFDLQTATNATTRAQDDLNRITERYDAILNPLQGKLDDVRSQQQHLADQQRLIAAQNTLVNFDSTAAEKRAAQLEIEQISLQEQISTVEQKKKTDTDAAQANVDGAKKQQDAAQKQLDVAQATIDQQVETNNLLGEQKRLTEQLAAAQEAAAKKAESAAETANNKAKQAAEAAQRLADQLHDAQLRYNLQIADTPGKIAIMEAELAKTKVGSVEYFAVLTQLDQLHKQYNNELEKAAKNAGALGETNIGAGLSAGVTAPLGEASKAGKNLAAAIGDVAKVFASPEIKELPANLKNIADSLKSIVSIFSVLSEAIGPFFKGISSGFAGVKNGTADVKSTLSQISGFFQENKTTIIGIITALGQTIGLLWRTMINELSSVFQIFKGIFTLNWSTFWDGIKNLFGSILDLAKGLWTILLQFLPQAFTDFSTNFGASWSAFWNSIVTGLGTNLSKASAALEKWFTDAATTIGLEFTKLGTAFYTGGSNLIGQFWDGLKAKWGELSSWFSTSLAGLRAQLPFSEPKDPNSPLRGLAKSGESMVNMIQGGINKASLSINPLANALLPSAATTNNTNHSTANNMSFSITINGARDTEAAKSGAVDGVKQALRAAGLL